MQMNHIHAKIHSSMYDILDEYAHDSFVLTLILSLSDF